MTSTWIAKNPNLNNRNKGLSVPMNDAEFEDVMRSIVHADCDFEAKLELLLKTSGFFNGEQVCQKIWIFISILLLTLIYYI